MSDAKATAPVDIHVGQRIRMRRIMIGMSQQALAQKLGLTFQQVQKYEKGANRIGASRLYQIAEILEVPVFFLFEDLPGTKSRASEHSIPKYLMDFTGTAQGLRLVQAFARIPDNNSRNDIVRIVESIAAGVPERMKKKK